MPKRIRELRDDETVPAEEVDLSLAQAILAPLDAIFKAQVHAARSFLNLVLQLGYPEQPANTAPGESRAPYDVPFTYKTLGANNQTIEHTVRVPTLSLVPLAPLTVESADVRLHFQISSIAKHRQLRKSAAPETHTQEKPDSPWFLVDDPVSVRGKFSPTSAGAEETSREAIIEVSIKMARIPAPEVLQRTLSMLGNSAYTEKSPPNS